MAISGLPLILEQIGLSESQEESVRFGVVSQYPQLDNIKLRWFNLQRSGPPLTSVYRGQPVPDLQVGIYIQCLYRPQDNINLWCLTVLMV